jgi:hypothetical protein
VEISHRLSSERCPLGYHKSSAHNAVLDMTLTGASSSDEQSEMAYYAAEVDKCMRGGDRRTEMFSKADSLAGFHK